MLALAIMEMAATLVFELAARRDVCGV